MEWDWLKTATELNRLEESFVLITISDVSGSVPREVGTKLIVRELEKSPSFYGTIGGGELEYQVIREARDLILQKGHSKKIRYPLGAKTGQCCGGVVECFFEIVNPPWTLYVFGAGHVGQALGKVLEGTPIRTVLVDDRQEWLDQILPSSSCKTERSEPLEFIEKKLNLSPAHSLFAIMTHSHSLDLEICIKLLPQNPLYIGLIGSESKRARFEQMLRARGVLQECISRLNCPMGLNIGQGKTPKEVAISIAAGVLKFYYEQRSILNISRGEVLSHGLTQGTDPQSKVESSLVK